MAAPRCPRRRLDSYPKSLIGLHLCRRPSSPNASAAFSKP
jgi:hypothetical protein